MAHSPGDLVEVVTERDGDKVTGTAAAIVVGNADENGEAVSVHVLSANHYASDGNELGQIYKKPAAKSEAKSKAKKSSAKKK